ncbi:MAG TPA: hypothetical protein VN699_01505 [Pirellulales bacterium]|nr:hypothetical protein [Pirellulales bacterium]
MRRIFAILIGAWAIAASAAVPRNSGDAAEPIEPAQQGAAAKTEVKFYQLGQDVEVIGALGRPLGKVLVVEGSLFQPKPRESIPKIYESKTVFVAERVDDEALKKPVHIFLTKAWHSDYADLKPRQKLKLTGYEDGGFKFESEDAWAYRRRRGEGEAARMQRHFNVDFFVLDAQPVGELGNRQKSSRH